MKTPRGFFKPLAIGAPTPWREPPARVERMIHFVPPHLDKVRAKVPEIAPTVDVILANLEDAIPADAKGAALAGTIAMARETDFKALGVGLWVRINCLNSPWHLDEVATLVEKAGDRIDVIMVPKVEGPWDIHYVDRLLAQLEAKAGIEVPYPQRDIRLRGLFGEEGDDARAALRLEARAGRKAKAKAAPSQNDAAEDLKREDPEEPPLPVQGPPAAKT